MQDKEHGPQEEVMEDLSQRFNVEVDNPADTPESSRGPLTTPIIRSVQTNTIEPTIQMTMTQLRAFITEAVAQAIPTDHPVGVTSPGGEKRKAVSFEREGVFYEARELEMDPLQRARTDGMETQRKRGRDKEKGGYVRATPFTQEVLMDDLPVSFRSFIFEYDGIADPWEHVCRFENTSQLHLLSDGVKCRVFAITLTGAAQQWFGQLPRGCIPTFGKLCSMFLHHFASSRKHQKSTITLFSIKQQAEESLRGYVKRFNTAMLEVPVASEEIKIRDGERETSFDRWHWNL